MIITGDCRDVLATLDADSVDAVVTDPPYELAFMAKNWDGTGIAYDVAMWRAVLRVMKPGAHLVAFGGTRTHHRMMVAIEDAGFEIRDVLMWLYGSGFPKSLDVSKAIDKAAGAEREVVGEWTPTGTARIKGNGNSGHGYEHGELRSTLPITAPATDDAARWSGWGTALKPAFEPIVLARKPLSEPTVAKNVLRWGTGAINVDASRIGTNGETWSGNADNARTDHGPEEVIFRGFARQFAKPVHPAGRWPANVILSHSLFCVQTGTREIKGTGHYPAARGTGGLSTNGHAGQTDLDESYTGVETVETWECVDDCPIRMLDAQSGRSTSQGGTNRAARASVEDYRFNNHEPFNYRDTGGASRYFYTAKASRAERERGLDGLDERSVHPPEPNGRVWDIPGSHSTPRRNHHPTVKPVALMRYLVRLVTPPNGLVLDPFAGSGSTGIAALDEGFQFVGIEREAEYADIATRRMAVLR